MFKLSVPESDGANNNTSLNNGGSKAPTDLCTVTEQSERGSTPAAPSIPTVCNGPKKLGGWGRFKAKTTEPPPPIKPPLAIDIVKADGGSSGDVTTTSDNLTKTSDNVPRASTHDQASASVILAVRQTEVKDAPSVRVEVSPAVKRDAASNSSLVSSLDEFKVQGSS